MTASSTMRASFREGMAVVVAAVHVVTAAGPDGDAGITATAVCSVSDSPPSLLVCLNRNSYAHSVIRGTRALAVNTLAEHQRHLASVFAGQGGRSMPDRFDFGTWTRGGTGAPLLAGSVASFDCQVFSSNTVGTHEIFVCHVLEVVRSTSGRGLGYAGRRYFGVDTGTDLTATTEEAS